MDAAYGSWTTVNEPEPIRFEKIKRRKPAPKKETTPVTEPETVAAEEGTTTVSKSSSPPAPTKNFVPMGFTTVGYVGEQPSKKRKATEDVADAKQPEPKKVKSNKKLEEKPPIEKKGSSLTITLGTKEVEFKDKRKRKASQAIDLDSEDEEGKDEEEYNEELFEKELAQVQELDTNGPLVPGMKPKSNEPVLSRRQQKRERRKKRRKILETIVDLTGPDIPINLDADEGDVIKVINAWVEDKKDWVPLPELTKFLKTKFQFNSWVELCGMRAKNFLWRCENVMSEVFEGELHVMKWIEEAEG